MAMEEAIHIVLNIEYLWKENMEDVYEKHSSMKPFDSDVIEVQSK